jgi:hypothetical protein
LISYFRSPILQENIVGELFLRGFGMEMLLQRLKSLLVGVGSVMNVAPAPRNVTIRVKSDIDSIRSDWRAVGDDLRSAICQYEELSGQTDRKAGDRSRQ